MSQDFFLKSVLQNLVEKYVGYIGEMGLNFHRHDEGYKYDSVATFRKYFNLESDNFLKTLDEATKDGKNLIQSGQYYPRQMLLEYAKKDQEFIREQMGILLEGKMRIGRRIDDFINNVESRLKGVKQSYFDARFLSFFLACHNPKEFIYFKSQEYKGLAKMIEYDVELKGTQGEKYEIALDFANRLREVLRENEQFLKIHKKITDNFTYKDPDLSWGTFDFIYVVPTRPEIVHGIKKDIDWNKKIATIKQEELEEFTGGLKADESISKETKEETMKKAMQYKQQNDLYETKEGLYRLRKDNNTQKARVKKIEEYKCQVCGFYLEYRNKQGQKRFFIHAEHIKEKGNGGTEELENLWILCPNCHAKKTLGVIKIDPKLKKVEENGKEIKITDNHLGWYK